MEWTYGNRRFADTFPSKSFYLADVTVDTRVYCDYSFPGVVGSRKENGGGWLDEISLMKLSPNYQQDFQISKPAFLSRFYPSRKSSSLSNVRPRFVDYGCIQLSMARSSNVGRVSNISISMDLVAETYTMDGKMR